MKNLLNKLIELAPLSETEGEILLDRLTDETVDPHQKAAALVLMEARGVHAQELRGMARAMLRHAVPVPITAEVLVDTAGTGGDGSGSLNLSTATALLVAALGLPVAKHGNRSVSSRSGSADVLEALGLSLAGTPSSVAADIEGKGFSFLFAPAFHPAMKALVPVRRGLALRTAFNLLGPLTNPARPTHQLLGAFSESAAELLAKASMGLGSARVFVVHGALHWDEATPIGAFILFDVKNGGIERRVMHPSDFGIPTCSAAELAGGDARENALRLEALLRGQDVGAHEDTVVLNAALVLLLTGQQTDLKRAADAARQALHDGRSAALLDHLVGSSRAR